MSEHLEVDVDYKPLTYVFVKCLVTEPKFGCWSLFLEYNLDVQAQVNVQVRVRVSLISVSLLKLEWILTLGLCVVFVD